MNIKMVKIGEVKPYDKNPRKNDNAVDKVAASLKEFGFKQPLVVDKDGILIVGHTRLKAAKKLGMNEVPVLYAEDLTEAQVKAYRLADNKTNEFAEWDEEMLSAELQELNDIDFGMLDFGFEEIGEVKEIKEDDFDVDEALGAIVEPTAKRGDIWQLGKHRLMCGDSTVVTDVEKLMNGNKADMVFTDPPYGVSYKNNMNDKFDTIKNDDVFLDGWIPLINHISNGFLFMWTSYQVLDKWLEITKPLGKLTNMIIWSKGGGGLGDLQGAFSTDYEVCLVWNRGAKLTGKRIGSVWSIGKDGTSKYVHPTQKPIALGAEAIDKTTKEENKVLDLFGGSGSTLMACEQTNRICYMMELDEKYVDVIIKRWETLTGNKAELVG
jgi:DNA modification methylase